MKENKNHCGGQQRLQGFDGLVEEVACDLVVDIHDLADLFIA